MLLLGHDGVPWAWLALQLPIVLLMLAAAQRSPTGGRWARALWQQGRLIVTLTALLNLAWTARLLWLSDDWALWPELLLASFCLIDLAIALALWRDKFFATTLQRVSGARTGRESERQGVIRIFIGFDERETVAWHVLTHSIHARASRAGEHHAAGAEQPEGVFTRARAARCSRPTSPSRASSRLTCAATRAGRSSWIATCWCGDDIAELWALRDERYAVMVRAARAPAAARP